jgi:hypothetical protein
VVTLADKKFDAGAGPDKWVKLQAVTAWSFFVWRMKKAVEPDLYSAAYQIGVSQG